MAKRTIRFCIVCWIFAIVILQLCAFGFWSGYISLSPIDKFINKCGKNYFYSSLIINNNSYSFDDVSGCDDDYKDIMTCIYSIKRSNQNAFYNKTHSLDKRTLEYLDSKFHNETSYIADVNKLRQYKSIDTLLSSTIKTIKSAWIKVIKSDGIIQKIFIITTSEPKDYCDNSASEIIRGI